MYRSKLQEKLREALQAVGPILIIVLGLSFTVAPLPAEVLLTFLLGSGLLVLGEMFFSLGAELAMEPMGERLGAGVTRTRKLPLILATGFLLGFLITISEPDLSVLAGQIQAIPRQVLILAVGLGVGIFLVLGFIQKLFAIPLKWLLMGLYGLLFLLTLLVPSHLVPMAFDAGGVTTGPMTVPFILSFGLGISAIRNDKRAMGDSMGLVAVCSVGPVLTVLILGLIYRPSASEYTETLLPLLRESVEMGQHFLSQLPAYMGEMIRSLLPMVAVFSVYQLMLIRLNRKSLRRIAVGLAYTFIGLVLFLTGANVGFMPAGLYLGRVLGELPFKWILIPLGGLLGYFILKAEPAVAVLRRQVEQITDGAVSGRKLQISLCLGMALSVGLSMLRVLTGLPLLWLVLPGYGLALLLSLLTPDMFTAIAFDSGGVASGPMTATFLLPLAIGAALATGGNVITDAFGVVSLVAMTPLITIQLLGLTYRMKEGKAPRDISSSFSLPGDPEDYAVIEL